MDSTTILLMEDVRPEETQSQIMVVIAPLVSFVSQVIQITTVLLGIIRLLDDKCVMELHIHLFPVLINNGCKDVGQIRFVIMINALLAPTATVWLDRQHQLKRLFVLQPLRGRM